MTETLKEKTAKGFFWGMLNNGTTQLLNFVIGLVLLQVLTQEDYGLVGVLAIFTAMAGNLQSCGFSQALTNLKVARNSDYNAVFWFNILVGIACYILLYACAPLIAHFYGDERLTNLSRLVFLSFLISAFGIAHGAYMYRNLMVKQTALIGFVALTTSGFTGIILALNGYTYWSLAWQQIVYISVLNIGRYTIVPWHPTLHIDLRPLRPVMGFSMNMLFTKMVNTLSQNFLTVIIGRLFPIGQVGTYQTAYKWQQMAYSLLNGMIDQVAQPVLARITDNHEREKLVFRKMAQFIAFLSFPCMLGLVLVAKEFFQTLLPARWITCVPLMQILCLSGAFMPFYTLYQQLTVSRGRSDIYLWVNLSQMILLIALIIAVAHWGITVMVIAYTLFNILFLLVWQFFARRLIGVRFREVATDLLPFLLAAILTMSIVYAATLFIYAPAILLFTRIVMATAVYYFLMKIAHVELLDEAIMFVKAKFKHKNKRL